MPAFFALLAGAVFGIGLIVSGMADPAKTVKIGVGRDAADVSFMTVFGEAKFGDKEVVVKEIP